MIDMNAVDRDRHEKTKLPVGRHLCMISTVLSLIQITILFVSMLSRSVRSVQIQVLCKLLVGPISTKS